MVFLLFVGSLFWAWHNHRLILIIAILVVILIWIFIIKRKKTRKRKILEDVQLFEPRITYRLNSYFVKRKPIEHKSLYTDSREIWDIGDNVRDIRNKKGMTQKHLSELMGYKSTSFISRLEYGHNEKITYEQIEKLALVLNVELDEILMGYERINNNDGEEE